MNKLWQITIPALFMMACLAEGLSAQEGCFKYNFKKAKQQFSSGDYILARKYFQAAESCFDLPPGQLTVISDKIAACDDSIKVQDELKNRRLVAQSLYGLAKTAVAENQYLKALRFMRYANAYFPDNPEFLPVMARLVYEGPHHAADTSSSKTMSLLPIRSVKIDTTPFPGLVEENTYHSFQYYDFDGDFRAKLSLDSRYLLIRSISGIRLVDLENGIDKLLIADPRDRQFEFINYGKNIIIYEHKDFYYLDPQESYGGKYDYSEVSIWNTQGELLLSLKNPRAVRSFPYNGLLWVVPENRGSLVLYNCDGRLLRNFDFDATVNYICANRVAEEQQVLVATDSSWFLIQQNDSSWAVEKTPLSAAAELDAISDGLTHLILWGEVFEVSGKKIGEIDDGLSEFLEYSAPFFTPDNRSIAILSREVNVVDLNGEQLMQPFSEYGQVIGQSITVLPAKNQLLVHFDYAAESGMFTWEGDSPNATILSLEEEKKIIQQFNAKAIEDCSPDGGCILRRRGGWGETEDYITLYDVNKGANRLIFYPFEKKNGISDFSFSEDGRFLLHRTAPGSLHIYDLHQANLNNRYPNKSWIVDVDSMIASVISGQEIAFEDWEKETPFTWIETFNSMDEYDNEEGTLHPALASGEPFLEFVEFGHYGWGEYLGGIAAEGCFWFYDDYIVFNRLYCLSVGRLIKATNHIHIPDFTTEEKERYGIDPALILDMAYAPLPQPEENIQKYWEKAWQATRFGDIAMCSVPGSAHQFKYKQYAIHAYKELFKMDGVEKRDSSGFLKLLAHFYPQRDSAALMAERLGVSVNSRQWDGAWEFFPEEKDPCDQLPVYFWDFSSSLRDLDTLKLQACLQEYQARADTTGRADISFHQYLTLEAAVRLFNNQILQASEVLKTAFQIDTTDEAQFLQAYLYLLNDQYEEGMSLLGQLGDDVPYDWSGDVLTHLKRLAREGITHPNLARAYRQLTGRELDDYERWLFRLE